MKSLYPGLLALFLVGQAEAAELHLSGFGTAGISCFTNNDADFRHDDLPSGPGRSQDCDVELDSKLGFQLDFEFTKRFGATVQVVGQHLDDDTFGPRLELANFRYRPTDDWTLRLGRLQNPSFLYSEFRNVHYAQPWVRPPTEVYGTLPYFYIDGFEFIHESSWSDWLTEIQAGVGVSDFQYPISNSDEVDTDIEAAYINLSLEKGDWLWKLGVTKGKGTLENDQIDFLFATLRDQGHGKLADDLEMDDDPWSLYSLSMSYRPGDWLILSEMDLRETDGFIPQETAVYVTLGKRYGRWLPYVTLARRWVTEDDTDNTIPAGDPCALPGGTSCKDAVDALISSATDKDHSSLSLGASYELFDTATLKTEVKWIRPDDDSWGDYLNHGPGYDFENPGSDFLFTLNLDFVF